MAENETPLFLAQKTRRTMKTRAGITNQTQTRHKTHTIAPQRTRIEKMNQYTPAHFARLYCVLCKKKRAPIWSALSASKQNIKTNQKGVP
jgi:hypothetical protein